MRRTTVAAAVAAVLLVVTGCLTPLTSQRPLTPVPAWLRERRDTEYRRERHAFATGMATGGVIAIGTVVGLAIALLLTGHLSTGPSLVSPVQPPPATTSTPAPSTTPTSTPTTTPSATAPAPPTATTTAPAVSPTSATPTVTPSVTVSPTVTASSAPTSSSVPAASKQ